MAEEKKVRDFWDKLSLWMGVFTVILVPAFGWYLNVQQNKTNAYLKRQELEVSKATIIEKYLPHLDKSVDPNRQMAALAVISSLGYKREAIFIAKLNPSDWSIDFLKMIVVDSDEPEKIQALAKDAITVMSAAGSAKADKALVSINKGPWAAVIGAYPSLPGAQAKINRAHDQGFDKTEIYFRQNVFRTVILFDNREQAQQDIEKIRKSLSNQSYIVNLDIWCPKKEAREGYCECVGE